MKAVISTAIDCGDAFNISATLKNPNDVKIITLKEGITFSKETERDTIEAGDIVEVDYVQDLKEKTTKITNFHGRFLKAGEEKPYAHFLLLKTHTEKLQFPTAFVFPKPAA